MANTFLTPTIIAREALFHLLNNMVMGNLVHREYKKEFVKVGDTITIRKPNRFPVVDGAASSVTDLTEASTTIVVNKQRHVDVAITSKDLTLSVKDFGMQILEPAMIALANDIDMELCKLYIDLFHTVGTAGTTPASFSDVGLAGEKLDLYAVPKKDRCLVVNPTAEWSLADGLKGLYEDKLVRDLVRDAYLGTIGGFKIVGDQNIRKHTKGIATGTPLSNGATQTGASIITDGWTASQTGIVLKGDIIRFAGVNGVNPESKTDTGKLMDFVVTADANSGAGAGAATISISPAIVTTGVGQNVTNSIADNSAITVIGSHTANMAFHKNALALVVCPLDLPEGAAYKARESYNGITIRYIRDYDFANDKDQARFDVLFGVKAIYPDLACRLLG